MIAALGSFILTAAFIVAGFKSDKAETTSRCLLVVAACCFLVNFLGYIL